MLRILNGAGEPLPQTEIGKRMLSTRANVTKLVDFLEKKGFVKRLACGDRRVKLIQLTSDGARFLEETLTEVLEFAERFMRPLTRHEQKLMTDLLNKLTAD